MRLFLSIICSFLTFSSISATNVTQIIKVINGKRFIVEKDDSYALNEDYLLVKLKNGLDIPTGMKIINSNKLGYLHVAVPDNIDVEDYSKYLKETNQFEIVEYIGEIKYNLSPNDSYISNQWYINAVNLKDAWNITTGNSNIKVAVIDSGVEASHYDLGNGTDSYSNISTSMGYDYINHSTINFPSFYHGTFVAGIIGAKTNNSLGISGVSGGNHSQGITIIPYNMGGSDNEGDAPLFSLYLANAILDAISLGVNIINLSLSTSQTSDIASAIEYAYYHNINIVCAAGNNNSSSISYPASSQYTIAVGASGHNNHRCSFSNYGNGLDLVAPGKDIYSTSLSNSYVYKDGTSFSTAMVSGVLALMLSVNPNLTPSEVRNILHSTSAQIEGYSFNNGWNQQVGYGLLNAHAAVKQAFQIDITGPSIMCSQELFSISGMPINDNNVILNSHSSTGISIEVSSNLNIISYSHGILNVQKVENGHYSASSYILSFIGFLPADKPEAVVYVAIDNAHNVTQYGGTASAPVAKNVMKAAIEVLDIKPSYDGMPKEYTYLDEKYVEVPDVIGLSIDEAKKVLKGFTLNYSGNGTKIVYQSPEKGMYIKEKGTVTLMLS